MKLKKQCQLLALSTIQVNLIPFQEKAFRKDSLPWKTKTMLQQKKYTMRNNMVQNTASRENIKCM